MTEEGIIQKQIIDYLTALGYLVFRMNAGGRGYNIKKPPAGTPDLFAVNLPVALWIEVKTITGKVSDVQKEMYEKLRIRGQRVIVARSVEDVMEVVK